MNFEKSDEGWLRLRAPAKVNLMLCVHGRRKDGFHDLTSVLMPLEFCDELELRMNDCGHDTLVSDGITIPVDDSNLVLQAARFFRQEFGNQAFFDFRLHKRIPVGAGLGGGSSDAVAALKGINALLEVGLSAGQLREAAACLGSDCPFFVDAVPAVVRGRGEQIEPLGPEMSDRLSGQRVALFRPPFGIDTGWAYREFAASPDLYEDESSADIRLKKFAEGGALKDLLHNQFEAVVGRKFLAIGCLLETLRHREHRCMMSGSGSVCFALVQSEDEATDLKKTCLQSWGENIFWVETWLANGKI